MCIYKIIYIYLNNPYGSKYLLSTDLDTSQNRCHVGKTVPFFTTYDWEWFIQTIKMVMTGGW